MTPQAATHEAQSLPNAQRLLTALSFAVDAAWEVSANYPEKERDYAQKVLADITKRLADALEATLICAQA